MDDQPDQNTNQFGYFQGDVTATWLTHQGNDRLMKLTNDFSFFRSSGEVWTAPAGIHIDGATTPRLSWIFTSPFVGNYRRASVIHDHYCVIKTRPSRTTHRVFYEGCRADGTPKKKAKIMYLAVKWFGPDWVVATQALSIESVFGTQNYDNGAKIIVPALDNDKNFEALRYWVETEDPSIDDIDERVEPQRTPQYLKGLR